MSVAGRDGTDGVDKLAKDAFIFSIFCALIGVKITASLVHQVYCMVFLLFENT